MTLRLNKSCGAHFNGYTSGSRNPQKEQVYSPFLPSSFPPCVPALFSLLPLLYANVSLACALLLGGHSRDKGSWGTRKMYRIFNQRMSGQKRN